MSAPPAIHDLVARFDAHRDAYRSGQYNETQARREFIDPFFEALGWDVNNRQGYAEAYKDVIHEDAIKVGGATKAPEKAVLQRQIETTDWQIDRLVYELYGLTEAEIGIVETREAG